MRYAAAAASLLLGLGFGVPCVLGIRHFARTHEVWKCFGFPTYGRGPFERVGLKTSMPLLIAFLLVCMAETAVGILLLLGAPHAAAASYALLPVEFVFWIGFALPFGPVLGLARTVLLLLA